MKSAKESVQPAFITSELRFVVLECSGNIIRSHFISSYSVVSISKLLTLIYANCYSPQALSAVGPSLWSSVSTCQTPAASPSAVTSIKVVSTAGWIITFLWLIFGKISIRPWSSRYVFGSISVRLRYVFVTSSARLL